MKQFLFAIFAVAIMASCSGNKILLTPSGVEVDAASLPKEEAKKLEKMQDSLYQARAAAAVNSSNFVLEANQVIFDHGRTQPVTSNTNFIMVAGNKVVVQVSPSVAGGPNGVGGITLDGQASNVKISTDKHGGVTYTMTAIGTGLSANIVVKLSGGGDYATATVSSSYHSSDITLNGRIVPRGISSTFKGLSR